VTRTEWSPGNFINLSFGGLGQPIIELYVDNGTRRVTWTPTQREILADDWERMDKPPAQGVNASGFDAHTPMGGK